MERPLKRVALDSSVGLLAWLPADVWNHIVWTLLTPSDRLELRSVCKFFHAVCWRRGVSLLWPDAVQKRDLHDALNSWGYITELKAVEASDASARSILGRCSSLTSLTFASADEQPSSALWLPPPSTFPRLKHVCFELDDCLTGELGAWACGLTALTALELKADDESSCKAWRLLGEGGGSTGEGRNGEEDENSCSSLEDEHERGRIDLSTLPITSLILRAEDPLPAHKLATICRALSPRLQRLELRLGDADNPIVAPDLTLLSLLTRLRTLSMLNIESAGRLRLPPLPSLEALEFQMHDTTFTLRCLTAMTSLRSIRLSSSFSGNRTIDDAVVALRGLTNLTELDISHSPEELDPHRIPATELTNLSLLTCLARIKLRANFEPSAPDHLNVFTSFSRLSCLELSYCDLRALDQPTSWEPLSRLPQLSVLKLKGAPPCTTEAHLASALAAIAPLSTLHFEVQSEWNCEHLSAAINQCQRLRVLSLGPIRHAQLTVLMPVLTRLHSLSFWVQHDEPAVDLYAALPQLRWLRFSPLTGWVELTPNPFLLLQRIPRPCATLFYAYGYLHQQSGGWST